MFHIAGGVLIAVFVLFVIGWFLKQPEATSAVILCVSGIVVLAIAIHTINTPAAAVTNRNAKQDRLAPITTSAIGFAQ